MPDGGLKQQVDNGASDNSAVRAHPWGWMMHVYVDQHSLQRDDIDVVLT